MPSILFFLLFSGVNKHFQLFFIYDKFTNNGNRDVKSQVLWDHLGTMYNLEALELEQGGPNFPNDEREFYLDNDYDNLKETKQEAVAKQEEKKAPPKGRETPKKEIVKKEKEELKLTVRGSKERRDSNSSKDSGRSSVNSKKESKKEMEKVKPAAKTRVSTNSPVVKDETKSAAKSKAEDTPRPTKRPTRGSLKPDDSSSNGKASPVTVNTPPAKRRRI